MSMVRRIARWLPWIAAVSGLTACNTLLLPGNTASITFVSTATTDGWRYDYYRNTAYPCSVSGYQTFVDRHQGRFVATRAAAPLWAFMHGGGAGYFDAAGQPDPEPGPEGRGDARPSLTTHADQQRAARQGPRRRRGLPHARGLVLQPRRLRGRQHPRPAQPEHHARRQAPPDERRARDEGRDPVRAEPLPDDEDVPPRRRARARRARSASRGRCSSRASRRRASSPTRASSTSRRSRPATRPGSAPTTTIPARVGAIAARVHPDLANIDERARQARRRAAGSRCRSCTSGTTATRTRAASPPVACPLRDGSHVTMGYTDCIHEPMRHAIAAQGPTSRSKNLPVCVDNDATPDCSLHVVTSRIHLTNTDPSTPADYLAGIMTWVDARLKDA